MNDDPRAYIQAAKRLALEESEWSPELYTSISPRSSHDGVQGTWDEWVTFANLILEADQKWKESQQ